LKRKGWGEGTGLEVGIPRQIIQEKHQDKITINSAIGMATDWIISLPAG
jgi:nitrogen-specific signal transduction histidine kinase